MDGTSAAVVAARPGPVRVRGWVAMARERRRVTYEGRVQGVGFRATARRLASGFPVAGFVRNLPDGGVELVAEGEPGEVDRFLAAVTSEMGWLIRSARQEPLPPGDPPYDDFSIRH